MSDHPGVIRYLALSNETSAPPGGASIQAGGVHSGDEPVGIVGGGVVLCVAEGDRGDFVARLIVKGKFQFTRFT
jgi:hypothetical protein